MNSTTTLNSIEMIDGDDVASDDNTNATVTSITSSARITVNERSPAVMQALYVIPFVTASISLLSSLFLVRRIIQKSLRHKNGFRIQPRQQLLLGLSLFDITSSFALAFSTTPAPAILQDHHEMDARSLFPTFGTITTCDVQGFLVQLGIIGTPFYNLSLCLYYILSVRYQYKDNSTLLQRLIPTMHVFIVTIAFTTAIVALRKKLYNYSGTSGCWIGSNWILCWMSQEGIIDEYYDEDKGYKYCDRGINYEQYELYFALIPVGFCFLFVVISMIILYITVRTIEARSRRWDFHDVSSSMTQLQTTNNPGSPTTSRSSATTRRGSITSTINQDIYSNNNTMPLTKRMRTTGLLYGASFILVYLPTALVGIVSSLRDSGRNTTVYIFLLILVVILMPLQGFFNMLIYTSPDWLPIVQKYIC